MFSERVVSKLLQVHDSLWERPHCLQIVERALPCLATVTHLAAPSVEECQEWVNVLKPLCAPQLSRATCKVIYIFSFNKLSK